MITYRELRLLELAVLRASHSSGQQVLDVQSLISVDVDQFYGIEIEEFPAQIAQVALWLTDHQMNTKVSLEFDHYFARIPLKATPHIVCGNALTTNWDEVLAPEQCSYMLGNPPFLCKAYQSAAQKSDMKLVCGDIKNAGLLDFVAAWYIKAARFIKQNKQIKSAFVSTNSITQGEQVGVLWSWMLAQGIKIHFSHRTFSWNNEARGKAAVHCVIIGFGLQDVTDKTIYEYADIKGEPHAVVANNINPYLVNVPDVVLENKANSICNVPEMVYGSKPTDGGFLLLNTQEKNQLIQIEPKAEIWIKPFLNADEFLNNVKRYCLWLIDCPPQTLRTMPEVLKRVAAVKHMRLASTKIPTVQMASFPNLFSENRQPKTNYLLVPAHSSQNRAYIPIGYMPPDVICGNGNFTIPNASLFHFGALTSNMHMAWMRAICGRMESRYRYSAGIVYNNFPWPELNAQNKAKIEAAAQAVLDARAVHLNASLADLYDPLTMPANLLKAHQVLDKAVDAAYGYKGVATDAARVAFLFERYQQITSLLPTDKAKTKKPPKKSN